MNEKFFSLPKERQQKILNAGYRVFAHNSYKKSPMSEIAGEAGISKALLFHYFHNKKELYLYLLDTCAKVTMDALEGSGCYEEKDLFALLQKGIEVKLGIMRDYPDMGFFSVKVFYEKDPEVCADIQRRILNYSDFSVNAKKMKLDPEQFLPGIDLEMMYWDMYWASEGYLWEKYQQGCMDVDEEERARTAFASRTAHEMYRDYSRLVAFWKSVYVRKKGDV